MAAIPTPEEEDTKRPNRERENLVGERTRIGNRIKSALARLGIRGFKPTLRPAAERLVPCPRRRVRRCHPTRWPNCGARWHGLRFAIGQIREIEAARLERLEQHPEEGPHAMVRMLAQIVGVGLETADLLVQEVLSRNLRDRRAVARYAGLAGTPDESGARRRENGLGQGRQCSRASQYDPIGLALSDVPKGQRVGPVVSGAHRRCPRYHPQDHDCRFGA